jgi:carbon-monoxide dehydrogenase medium subunit
MKPAAFDYLVPASVPEAVSALHECADEAKVIAGGQSLVPMMNFRLARPDLLVDLNRLDDLRYVRRDGDWLAIGALTTEHAVGTSGLVAEACPMLAEATNWIGHPAIRHRGTLGGSIAHGDPSAEYPLVAALLDAEVVAHGVHGVRRIPYREFALGHFMTALDETEIVTEVRFPVLPPGTGWAFLEVARRSGDFALASAAVTVRIEDGLVADARVALGAAGPTPLRVPEAESLLQGRSPTDDLLAAAGAAAAGAAEPASDLHASAEFRRHLCEVLTVRALEEARRNASR